LHGGLAFSIGAVPAEPRPVAWAEVKSRRTTEARQEADTGIPHRRSAGEIAGISRFPPVSRGGSTCGGLRRDRRVGDGHGTRPDRGGVHPRPPAGQAASGLTLGGFPRPQGRPGGGTGGGGHPRSPPGERRISLMRMPGRSARGTGVKTPSNLPRARRLGELSAQETRPGTYGAVHPKPRARCRRSGTRQPRSRARRRRRVTARSSGATRCRLARRDVSLASRTLVSWPYIGPSRACQHQPVHRTRRKGTGRHRRMPGGLCPDVRVLRQRLCRRRSSRIAAACPMHNIPT